MSAIETVNINIWQHCNLACAYCYGSFPERPTQLGFDGWCHILDLIADGGTKRVTFCGGEPTLYRRLVELLDHARSLGLQTAIITNGAMLRAEHVERLTMVGVTLDAVNEPVLRELGRSVGSERYLETFHRVCSLVAASDAVLKVNTVVTRLNLGEDLTEVLRSVRPSKWKPLQFTRVEGENDGRADGLQIVAEEFSAFVDRHRAALEAVGTEVRPEPEGVVRSTYVMLDPAGRAFSTRTGGKKFSRPVLEIGLEAAIEEAGGYDRDAFVARGGHVDVRSLRRALPVVGGDP